MVQDPKNDEVDTPGPSKSIGTGKEIQENMAAGKRHYYCSDYPEAVACFQEACSLLAEKHGQMAEECGDAYYYYGISLLELARRENGVLGNALKEDCEKVGDDENVEKREESNPTESLKKQELLEKPTTSAEQAGSSSKTEQTEEEEEEAEEEDDPDDISNMQLAWEMLELAKVVYQKREQNEKNSISIALCYQHLGELGLENENYPQAIGDLLECFKIQKEHLAETDRKLAETHYSLGLAYSFEKRYDCSLEHYQNALDILNARIARLEKAIEDEKEREKCDDVSEIREIKGLLPDITLKMEDVLAMKKETLQCSEGLSLRRTEGETTIGFSGSSSTSDPSCSSIPIREVTPVSSAMSTTNDISHLVRRKRTLADDGDATTKDESLSKKLKREPIGNDGNVSDRNASQEHCKEAATIRVAPQEKKVVGTRARKIDLDAPASTVIGVKKR